MVLVPEGVEGVMAGLHLRLCIPGEPAMGLGEVGGVGQHAQLGKCGLGGEFSTHPCRWLASPPLPAHLPRLGRCHRSSSCGSEAERSGAAGRASRRGRRAVDSVSMSQVVADAFPLSCTGCSDHSCVGKVSCWWRGAEAAEELEAGRGGKGEAAEGELLTCRLCEREVCGDGIEPGVAYCPSLMLWQGVQILPCGWVCSLPLQRSSRLLQSSQSGWPEGSRFASLPLAPTGAPTLHHAQHNGTHDRGSGSGVRWCLATERLCRS
jgi:hypothetical protein